ncbi:ABC transporter permease [Falsiroseomonas ponticola]|uniref:ABC transporter permease n=1 Tax=Falsiroseomonas ponticola TaxID=2786951 RepID=UPI0019321744|nr:ABC transporter permease [Roseomonas ponticola]
MSATSADDAPARPGPAAADWLLPALGGAIFLGGWETLVRVLSVPKFILPAPSLIFETLIKDRASLLEALGFTATITLSAFVLAMLSGIALGVALTQNRMVERTFWPYAVMMQVTPVIAIAPIIVIWVGLDRVWLALLILAWLVAFFPILSNTAAGMKSVDHGLSNVFDLCGASRWKRFRYLQLPGALPYILAGARISSGLSVIGAVVAEFVAGSGSATGLAWVIVESGSLLNVPRMFAALFLLSAFGITIWLVMSAVQRALLRRWHESELAREN